MFSTRSHSIIRQLAALALVFPVTTAVAQSRPLTIIGGVGAPSVSGSLADGGRPTWMVGVGTERRIASALALAVDIEYEDRGGTLTSTEFASNTTISFSTIGIAPTARFQLGGRRSSLRPVISSGILLWKEIGCSVDYDSEFDSGRLTETCSDYASEVQSPSPLESLSRASGATFLLGFGLGNDFVGFDLRAERKLGAGARTPNGELAFGNTISVMARFRPDLVRRIVPK